MDLDELAFQLNSYVGEEGTSFDAVLNEDGILEVICSNNDEFPIHMTTTHTQIIAVTRLFDISEVAQGSVNELDEMCLRLSPAIPLSSIGRQGSAYILFGAMALNTRFEVVAHELEVQAENTIDVLEAIEELLT